MFKLYSNTLKAVSWEDITSTELHKEIFLNESACWQAMATHCVRNTSTQQSKQAATQALLSGCGIKVGE